MLHPLNACHSRIATPNAQSDQSNWTNPIPLFDQTENFLDKNQNQKIKSWLWCVNFAIKLYDAWRFCQAQWCWKHESLYMMSLLKNMTTTRTSWLNCALRDDEAVYWVSIWHYEAVADGNWWYILFTITTPNQPHHQLPLFLDFFMWTYAPSGTKKSHGWLLP